MNANCIVGKGKGNTHKQTKPKENLDGVELIVFLTFAFFFVSVPFQFLSLVTSVLFCFVCSVLFRSFLSKKKIHRF